MTRIKLVVADSDNVYLERLYEYIKAAYHQKIQVSSFTNKDSLLNYLRSGEKIDIILINPEFYCNQIKSLSTGMVLLLSDGRVRSEDDALSINKYQPGDKLVTQLIELYAEKNKNAVKVLTGTSQTKIITVYSPCGGTGKTTIAINLANQLGLMGKSVFYLNMETVNSSLSFLSAEGEIGFSHILLHLNDKDCDSLLPVKIETTKVRDVKYNFDFFHPPECSIELSELDKKGTATLLANIRRMGTYDFVIVDTESALNERNISLFEYSDKILLLAVQDHLCNYKWEVMFRELSKVGLDIEQACLPVVNKFRTDSKISCNMKAGFIIPFIHDVILKNERSNLLVFNQALTSHVFELAKQILD